MSHLLERSQLVHAPPEEVFAFFSKARNLEALTPPWLRFEVITPEPIEMRADTLIDYRLHVHRLPLRWVSRIAEWQPGERFVDVQVRGPYRRWHHTHEFQAHLHGTVVRDLVSYELPLGRVGALAHWLFVRRDLERVFTYRQAQVRRLLDGHVRD